MPERSISVFVLFCFVFRDEQLLQFNFNSLHFFGESPVGAWKLTLTLEPFAKHGRISQGSISDFLATVKETLGFGSDGACLDKYGEQSKTCAVLHYWRLTFHGSPLPHEEVAKRIKLVVIFCKMKCF